jgi:HSP20 family protein
VAERRDIERLSSEIEELFSELWQVPRFARMRQGFRPQVDCYRSDEPPGFTVVLELPGVDPADVTVEAVGGSLVVSGERRRERAAGRHYEVMELDYGPFRRQIPLPGDIDVAQARATYERGLLTIVLPAAPQPTRPESVTIEVTLRP